MGSAGAMSERLCAHMGYLFNEVPLDARFAAAAKAGFSLVEVPNPYGFSSERIKDLLGAHGLRLIQINSHAGNPQRNEKGLACLADRREEFSETIAANVAYARQVGAEFLSVLSGVIPDGRSREELFSLLAENIALACDCAHGENLKVLIEPISAGAVPNYMMHDPRLALELMARLDRPNLYMLFDTFHAAHNGIDVADFVAEHGDRIGHIHLADFPGRHEPGTGALDFPALFQALSRTRYPFSIGLEYIPLADTVSGLSWRAMLKG